MLNHAEIKEWMTVEDLVDLLIQCPKDAKVVLHGSGHTYPALCVSRIHSVCSDSVNEVEIGGGWESLDYSGVDINITVVEPIN